MRRIRRRNDSLAVSLFPFLAVLICTMGVLIVMLVLAVKSADVAAKQVKQEYQENVLELKDELHMKLDTEQFRVDQLTHMRPDVKHRLQEERLRRGHLEDALRELRQQAMQLKQQWQLVNQDYRQADRLSATEQQQIDQLKARISESDKKIRQLRELAAEQRLVYSIVPAQSVNGTSRRPIYVECLAGGLRLQPSGIQISLREFTQPILPGNPLDAALLATREYWNKYYPADEAGEAYPLLVVRPGGATAYAIARRAMRSWDDEFGYELVAAEKQLDWGQPDENLTQVVNQAIAAAKKQQMYVGNGRPTGNSDGDRGLGQMSEGSGEESNKFAAGENSSVDPITIDELIGRKGRGKASSSTQLPDRRSAYNPLRDKQESPGQVDGSVSNPSALSNRGPLAHQRGKDWALPTRTPGATAYRRPIRIEIAADHYLVHASDPQHQSARIMIDRNQLNSVDELIDQVWRQIESWGMAESGGFWKPVLRVSTRPEAKSIAGELASMLEGSGLELEGDWR